MHFGRCFGMGVKTTFELGVLIEQIQELLKQVPGMEGFSESAWTPEDLISDFEGAALGNNVGLTGIPTVYWVNFLANAGVVAHKGDAKSILADDVTSWDGQRFKSYNSALEWQLDRPAHKCLCDGETPKPQYHE